MDFKRILDKLDILDGRLDSVDKTLIKQEANLDKHIMRTDQNEIMIQEIFEQIRPIQKHINYVEGILKFIGVLSILTGVAVAIKDLIK